MRSAQALMFTTFHVAAGDVFDFRVTLLLEEVDGAGAAGYACAFICAFRARSQQVEQD